MLFLNILCAYRQEQGRKISSERNSSIAVALLFSLGVKLVNNFHTDTQYFNTHLFCNVCVCVLVICILYSEVFLTLTEVFPLLFPQL
jgi:hypothetical protein